MINAFFSGIVLVESEYQSEPQLLLRSHYDYSTEGGVDRRDVWKWNNTFFVSPKVSFLWII